MMTDESLHLQVKTIETELSRAQSCLARGDVHAAVLHQMFAMSSFVGLASSISTQQTGKLGRRKTAQVDAVPITPEAAALAAGDAMRRIEAGERYVGKASATMPKAEFGLGGFKLQIPPGAKVDMEAVAADTIGLGTVPGLDWRPDADKPEPVPAPSQTPQTPPVRQSLRWEHVPDDFGGKMCLFIGAFDIISIQQDEDDNERAFYCPSTGWHHLDNIIDHWPSSIFMREQNLDQLMRTPEQAMRWTEEQLKLPILPTWLNGEQVTLAAHPEPQEPYWRPAACAPDTYLLMIGTHQIGAVYDGGDGRWLIDRSPKLGPFTFDDARTLVEESNRLRPCRVIR